MMKFIRDGSKNGALTLGYEEGWHWSKNKGSHQTGRDFFWVHWEISDDKPNDIKLHIESPKADVDPQLNSIKKQMVEAFLSPKFKKFAAEYEFDYKIGGQTKSEKIEKNKSTQAFRLILTDEQSQQDNQANIEMIHAATRDAVQEVINRFAEQLTRHFEA